MLHEDRARATSFGAHAELYHRTRPSYPAALVDDLMADAPSEIIDVGCGTGIAALLFVSRGARVLGVEVDQRMADHARSLGVTVEVSSFEDWPDRGRKFDLLVSGQAWHWVDPVRGAAKAAEVVRSGGRVALFWNRARHPGPVQAAFDGAYREIAPGLEGYSIVLGHGTGDRFTVAEDGLSGDGRFVQVSRRHYDWTTTYTRAKWLDHLLTHSDHQALPEPDRVRLLAAVGQAIDDMGGSFATEYETVVVTAVRR